MAGLEKERRVMAEADCSAAGISRAGVKTQISGRVNDVDGCLLEGASGGEGKGTAGSLAATLIAGYNGPVLYFLRPRVFSLFTNLLITSSSERRPTVSSCRPLNRSTSSDRAAAAFMNAPVCCVCDVVRLIQPGN